MLSAKIGRHICKIINVQTSITNTILTGAAVTTLSIICIIFMLSKLFGAKRAKAHTHNNKLLLIVFRDHQRNQIHSIACIPYKKIKSIRDKIDIEEYIKHVNAHTKNYQYKNAALFLCVNEKITLIQSLIALILKHSQQHKTVKIYIYDNVGIDINFISDIIYYSVGKIQLCHNSKIIDQQKIYLTVSEEKNIKFINVNYLLESSMEEMLTRHHLHSHEFDTIYSSLRQKHVNQGIFSNIVTYSIHIAYVLSQHNILL